MVYNFTHPIEGPYTGSRFPAFWGFNMNAIPDQLHGTAASLALQFMLVQTQGDRLFLLPAWPREWDVDFKLHAPVSTSCRCEMAAGGGGTS